MGEEDYLFLPTIKKIAQSHASALLVVIANCGHVVNVEKPNVFNDTVIKYLLNKPVNTTI
jgi:pimeloyl-ACP methyl ester carboxylesterase